MRAGDIWLADRGDETRRPVFLLSDSKFHRLADRAVIAPVLERWSPVAWPWHVKVGDKVVAVNQVGSLPTDRLLELVDRADLDTLRKVRRALREITT